MRNANVALALGGMVVGVLATVAWMRLPERATDAATIAGEAAGQDTADLRVARPEQPLGVRVRPAGEPSTPAEASAQMRAFLADFERRNAEHAQAMAREFASQRVDPAWAAETERRLDEAMTKDELVLSGIVPQTLEYSCRSTLCRVDATFAKHNDAADWGVMLVTTAGPVFANAMPTVTAGPDGTARLELYAARK
jgi:hypothetical protein